MLERCASHGTTRGSRAEEAGARGQVHVGLRDVAWGSHHVVGGHEKQEGRRSLTAAAGARDGSAQPGLGGHRYCEHPFCVCVCPSSRRRHGMCCACTVSAAHRMRRHSRVPMQAHGISAGAS